MRIFVLGADAWGTVLTSHATQLHDVMLWGRDTSLVTQMAATHINASYLPGITLRTSSHFSADLQAALDHTAGDDALAVIASPVAGLADLTRAIAAYGGMRNVIWLYKGFDPKTSALPRAIVADMLKVSNHTDLAAGVLSGPSFAREVAQGLPYTMAVVSTSDALYKLTQRDLHHHTMRVYASDDPVGVEVGGAVRNMLTIAAGAADSLGLELNTRAVLVTYGLAEMTRLRLAPDDRLEAFVGPTDVGGLLLTATGDLSHNRTVGMQLMQGRTPDSILHSLGHVTEGARCARAAAALARAKGVGMPVTFTVREILFEGLPVTKAVERLLQHDAKPRSTR